MGPVKYTLNSKQHFVYEEFRLGQIDAILAVLHGHVFVWMATGSGERMCMCICMYLPPLVNGKPPVAIIIGTYGGAGMFMFIFMNEC